MVPRHNVIGFFTRYPCHSWISVSSFTGSFVPQLSLRHHLFCSDGSIFSLSSWVYIFLENIPVINFHIKGRQDIGQKLWNALRFAGSFWHSTVFPEVIKSVKDLYPSRIWFSWTAIRGCNNVRFFSEYPSTPSFTRAFELGIFFSISWLIQTSFILFTFSIFFCSVSYVIFLYSRYHSKIWYYLPNSE